MENELLERVDGIIHTLEIEADLDPTRFSHATMDGWLKTLQACRDYIVEHERVFVGWKTTTDGDDHQHKIGETVCAECGAVDNDCGQWESIFEDDLDRMPDRVCVECHRDLGGLAEHCFRDENDATFEFARTR